MPALPASRLLAREINYLKQKWKGLSLEAVVPEAPGGRAQ